MTLTTAAKNNLDNWVDILVLVLYAILVLTVGLWSMRRSNRGNVKSYFLAGRTMSWYAVGASLFATNIGSEHFVGLSGAAASSGIAIILFEWLAVFLLIAGGWFFVPVFLSAGIYTFPEYMEKRYTSRKVKNYFLITTLAFAVVVKLATNMFAGSLFIQLASGWDMYLSVTVLLVITAIYTVFGGLAAVMYTDTFQAIVMVIGSSVLAGIAYNKVDGMCDLKHQYMKAIPNVLRGNTTCGFPNPDAFSLYQDPGTESQPWTGVVALATLGSLFYWCCDQVITQRYLAARSLQDAKGGAVLAGILKILPMFLMVIPGMVSRVLFTDEVACVDPNECSKICGNPSGCSNIAYPKLVLELLPIGLRGFLMAVIMSAIMSSLTSIFNSSSTVFTMDLWRQFRPQANQKELLVVGRLFVVFMCVVSVAWLPLISGSQGGQLYAYINMVNSCLMVPISTAFALTVFWKRITENGVFYGLLISHTLGVVRLVFEFMYPVQPCGMPENRPAFLYRIHFMNFGAILILISGIVIIGISVFTKPQSQEQLKYLTYWTRMQFPPSKSFKDETSSDTEEEQMNLPGNRHSAECIDGGETSYNGESANQQNSTANETGQRQPRKTPRGFCDHFITFLLGSSDKEHDVIEMIFDQKKAFLTERAKWIPVVNISAFVTMSVMFFLLGYYR